MFFGFGNSVFFLNECFSLVTKSVKSLQVTAGQEPCLLMAGKGGNIKVFKQRAEQELKNTILHDYSPKCKVLPLLMLKYWHLKWPDVRDVKRTSQYWNISWPGYVLGALKIEWKHYAAHLTWFGKTLNLEGSQYSALLELFDGITVKMM